MAGYLGTQVFIIIVIPRYMYAVDNLVKALSKLPIPHFPISQSVDLSVIDQEVLISPGGRSNIWLSHHGFVASTLHSSKKPSGSRQEKMPHNMHLPHKSHKSHRALPSLFIFAVSCISLQFLLFFTNRALHFSWWPERLPDLAPPRGTSLTDLPPPILIIERGQAVKLRQQKVVTEAQSGRSSQAIRSTKQGSNVPVVPPKYNELVEQWRKDMKLSQPHPPILPKPQQWRNGTTVLPVLSDFTFRFISAASGDTEVLDKAFLRYKDSIFRQAGTAKLGAGACLLTSLEVSVEDIAFTLDLETDEAYELSIPVSASQKDCPADGLFARITAKTQVGALRGLETFSQLVTFDLDTEHHLVRSAPWHISDAPRFAHREVLLDTARHFLPVPALKEAISAMAMAKLNVLHWHLTDHQSFPLTSHAYPLLSQTAAFSPSERYSPQDLKHVVHWARLHGIRVIPELDLPGHASSWCSGYPDLCPSQDCRSPLSPMHPTKDTPTAPNITFQVMDALLGELASSFSGDWMHIGADEVDTTCWERVGRIRAWMYANRLASRSALGKVVGFALEAVRTRGKRGVVWEEAFSRSEPGALPKDVVRVCLRLEGLGLWAWRLGSRV